MRCNNVAARASKRPRCHVADVAAHAELTACRRGETPSSGAVLGAASSRSFAWPSPHTRAGSTSSVLPPCAPRSTHFRQRTARLRCCRLAILQPPARRTPTTSRFAVFVGGWRRAARSTPPQVRTTDGRDGRPCDRGGEDGHGGDLVANLISLGDARGRRVDARGRTSPPTPATAERDSQVATRRADDRRGGDSSPSAMPSPPSRRTAPRSRPGWASSRSARDQE